MPLSNWSLLPNQLFILKSQKLPIFNQGAVRKLINCAIDIELTIRMYAFSFPVLSVL